MGSLKRLAGIAGLAAAVGCGGNDFKDESRSPAPPTPVRGCESRLTPCGGAVAGEWELSSECVRYPRTRPLAECPQATMTVTRNEMSQVLILRDDATFDTTTDGVMNITLIVPSVCLELTCREYGRNNAENLQGEFGVGMQVEAACRTDGLACVCDFTLAGTVDESGTYAVTDAELVLAAVETDAAGYEFCVEGDTLTLSGGNEVSTFERVVP